MLERTTVHWFPIRISYSNAVRLQRLRQQLDEEEGVKETFIPMKYKKVNATTMDFAPAVDNLLFVRIAFSHLESIKKEKAKYEPLRYIMHNVADDNYNEHSEPLYVPDDMMGDFIRVTSEACENVIFLDNLAFACKPSQAVQITEGRFAGVRGRIKRIKGNCCVVIPIEGTVAAAIMNLPRKHLRYLNDEELEKTKTI